MGRFFFCRFRFRLGTVPIFAPAKMGLSPSVFHLLAVATLSLAAPLQSVRAAITSTGDVNPWPASSWGTGTTGLVGNTASGTVTVDSDSLLSYDGYIGYGNTATGVVNVSGADSQWTCAGSLSVGRYGSGTLSVTSGGSVTDVRAYIGFAAGASGVATVDGPGSKWLGSKLDVGYSGTGTLWITGGGSVSNAVGRIGYKDWSTGMATVSGSGSTWTSAALYVGYLGSATLAIADGGNVFASTGYIGAASNDSRPAGTVTVSGASSTWTNSGNLYVAYYGDGILSISGGGSVSNLTGWVGVDGGAVGLVTVAGSGSAWTNTSDLYVGRNGAGTVTQTGGTVSAGTRSSLCLGDSESGTGTYNLNGGVLAIGGLVAGDGAAFFNFGGGTLYARTGFSSSLSMTLTGEGGDATVDTNGCAVTLSGLLSGSGGLTKIGAGTLTLAGSNTYTGTTTVANGTLLVDGSLLSPVNVVAGILGGSGAISGAVTVGSATLAPGSSPATLVISNALALSSSSTLSFDLCGTNTTAGNGINDLIQGVTTLTLDGTLNVADAVPGSFLSAQLGDRWTLIAYSGPLTDNGLTLGTMPALSDGLRFAVDATTTAGAVDLVVVPEPGTLALLAAGALALAAYARRRAKVVGSRQWAVGSGQSAVGSTLATSH
jgi:T5SS/PEP-CTERM-associated repeat protein/autotransporter-associated beta strand protein